VFTDWAKGLWKAARDSTPWLETGGLFGHEEAVAGTSVTATYDRLNKPKSLPYFTGWMMDTKSANSQRNIHWEYWVHTHPVSGDTKPSGIGGDLSITNIAELPAVIIGAKGKFSIWGVNNKFVCNGSIGKVE